MLVRQCRICRRPCGVHRHCAAVPVGKSLPTPTTDLLSSPEQWMCSSCWRIVEGWLAAPPPVKGEDAVVRWVVNAVLEVGEALIEGVPVPRLEALRRRIRSGLKATIGGSVQTSRRAGRPVGALRTGTGCQDSRALAGGDPRPGSACGRRERGTVGRADEVAGTLAGDHRERRLGLSKSLTSSLPVRANHSNRSFHPRPLPSSPPLAISTSPPRRHYPAPIYPISNLDSAAQTFAIEGWPSSAPFSAEPKLRPGPRIKMLRPREDSTSRSASSGSKSSVHMPN